ncbi:midasin [Sparassis latifolia]
MTVEDIHDPLTINLKKQTARLRERILFDQPSSPTELLHILSRLLYTPEYTTTVADIFRPLLLDLCARWLLDDGNSEDKFEALCLLLEAHPELYPVFSVFLRRNSLVDGPLVFVAQSEDVASLDAHMLHRILLGYYRILRANRDLPRSLLWSLSPLSKLIWTPHPDTGVRFLAIQCYAVQSGMMEGERVKLEQEVIGSVSEVDCPIGYGKSIDGSPRAIDGWLLPVYETKRVADARNAHLQQQDYFSLNENDSQVPIHPAELSPFTVNVHGILMLRSSAPTTQQMTLIETPTASQALRRLAVHHSLRVPTLLTSAPSAGKSLLLSHIAALLRPEVLNPIVVIQLADTSLDARSLLGSYVSSPTRPGTFEWKEGVLVRVMRQGKWVVFEDIDRASLEVLGLIKPLVESLGLDKWIGGRAVLNVPNRGPVEAEDGFAIYATRSVAPSRDGSFPNPTFYGAHKYHEMVVPSPTLGDLRMIVNSKFQRLSGAVARLLIALWEAVVALGKATPTRSIGLRELLKLCIRVDKLIPPSHQSMDVDVDSGQTLTLSDIFPNPTFREDMYLEARDVFFGSGATTASARAHLDAVAAVAAEHLGLSPERRDWILQSRTPEFEVEKDVNGKTIAVRIGRTRLRAYKASSEITPAIARPFAMHRPAIMLLSRISTAVSLNEPVLLTGETGTGKTSTVSRLASLLRQPLVSLNLSNQTESSDLLGGFKPVDARVPGSELQARFLELFGGTFSKKKNAKFEESVRKAVQESKWKRAVGLWTEAVKLAKAKIQTRIAEEESAEHSRAAGEAPRKRRKVNESNLSTSEAQWSSFERDVQAFEVQHVQSKSKFAFSFVEGPLVKALRSGHWILLDEINLASAETLECISSLLHGPTASVTLTEQGSLEPVLRHPDFRLFACMNPATDVGKKDLPPNIRSAFTEIDVSPPDADKETLLSIITQYIGSCTVGDKGAIMDIAEFYTAVKQLAEDRQIADGTNHRPHYSMRTLARALTFTADMASMYSLRRALWEGCLMTFTMVLDTPSAAAVTILARKHVLAGVRNAGSLLSQEPPAPKPGDAFIKFGPFWLERGPLLQDPVDDYIMTPSVEVKVINLARVIAAKRFPLLIEGPTSSGKTSSIEYLAKRTGHRFVRINNHEHTDIQEYLGTYVSDAVTGKLVFKDGLLVRALRNGDWIVLDELNLAPTDVLEALNRLLDDNRELVIPETHEVVRPHPHFMLFATQNPPGLYAGRKVLSRAFRNRFLEIHFEDVPQAELETILCQRCRIAPSYGQRIVAVFRELQKRRQSSRVFESKHGFATLRDLFRWAGRDALDYDELAANGYMLLAERARREDDKAIVKEVIETIMKVHIDERSLYDFHQPHRDLPVFLGCPLPPPGQVVWTSAMQRLFVLVSRALRFNEPVLLVGETGCGKTSVCQLYAETVSQTLRTVNCHQNTETADLIGGLRPVRNRAALESETVRETVSILERYGIANAETNIQTLITTVDRIVKSNAHHAPELSSLQEVLAKLQRLLAMFQWRDGPLVESMRNGDVFLLDEISLADDSVLERLNSVLEPERTIVLAERGGDTLELPCIKAADNFKLVATMNPGGDYGKKELSPALRNRFTEIWVPSVTDRNDLECIVDSLWRHAPLRDYTGPVLDFVEWLCAQANDRSILSLRDVLAWVNFSNATYHSYGQECMPPNELFHHAANMTFLDGLGSMPQFNSYSRNALELLRRRAIEKVQDLAPLTDSAEYTPSFDSALRVQLGSFSIPRGPKDPTPQQFSLQAPTTRSNVLRVVRACQLPKPILLEGSPGVGKTSLIAALANICGYNLCRINLSDQTDLVDLFGSDLPVEGAEAGQFTWKDAEFLRALQQGHWVLLDEMNLAPQAVLEGLNAVLDHRGTVYIPELGRSFTRHPSFRIFAAQNPLHEGGGRKGLPKSFLNRFTKVYVQELNPQDLLLICQKLFPHCPVEQLEGLIAYTCRLNEEVVLKRSFAREGAPWEFNLRDVIRWGTLLRHSTTRNYAAQYLPTIFLQRFRSDSDREQARSLFDNIFSDTPRKDATRLSISPSFLQVGQFFASRQGVSRGRRPGRILQTHLTAFESVGICLENSWLTILTGLRDSGKTALVRLVANMCGRDLQEISINNASDTTDILGSFEEVDSNYRATAIVNDIISLLDQVSSSSSGSKLHVFADYSALKRATRDRRMVHAFPEVANLACSLLDRLEDLPEPWCTQRRILRADLKAISHGGSGRLEWVDGPLVHALRDGHWLLLDGANLCSPSVLDRLNSLCEANGTLTLNERGQVDGQVQVIKPHPNFRLFMCVEPQYGELSRAMRNRGIEIALLNTWTEEDRIRIMDHLRLPVVFSVFYPDVKKSSIQYELLRRGAITAPAASAQLLDSRWPARGLSSNDSAVSLLIDLAPSLQLSSSMSVLDCHAAANFISRNLVPAYLPYVSRFLHASFASMNPLLQTILHSFSQSQLLGKILNLRGRLHRLGLPYEFLAVQPIPFEAKSLPRALYKSEMAKIPFDAIPRALRVVIALHFEKERAKKRSAEQSAETGRASRRPIENVGRTRAAEEARLLLQAVRIATQDVLQSFYDESEPTVQAVLDLTLKLLYYSRHLATALLDTSFNYSVVQVVVRWFIDALTLHYHHFAQVEAQANALADAVALTSGSGLTEIWTTLTSNSMNEGRMARVFDAEKLMDKLLDPTSLERRSQMLQVAAIWCNSGVASNAEQRDAIRLAERLEKWFSISPGSVVEPNGAEVTQVGLTFLTSELSALQRVLCREPLNGDLVEKRRKSLNELLDLGLQSLNTPLSHLLPYQYLLWATDDRTPEVHLSFVAMAHKQWLHEIWNISSDLKVDGPSHLFIPIELHGTLCDCDSNHKSLQSLAPYERALLLRLRLFSTDLTDPSATRASQVTMLLVQTITMICYCFPEAGGGNEQHASCAFHQPISTLLTILDESTHLGFKNAYRKHLRPVFLRMSGSHDAPSISLSDLGRCWIALSEFLVELYVPSSPIDPAALRRCRHDFWEDQFAMFSFEKEMYTQYEARVIKQPTGAAEIYLDSLLLEAEKNRVEDFSEGHVVRRNVTRLHAYWAEVSQFLSHVIPPAKVDAIVLALMTRSSHALAREQVVQESLTSFSQRLTTAYPDYTDVSGPLQLALLSMKLGLRLVLDDLTHSDGDVDDAHHVNALVAFPSVQSAKLLRESSGVSHNSALGPLLANFAGVTLEVSLGVDLQTHMQVIETIYEQAFGLWLIDRARNEDKDREAQSLYRKPGNSAVTEAEMEEQDFLEIFPDFENALEQEVSSDPSIEEKKSPLLDEAQVTSLYRLHELLLDLSLSHRSVADVASHFIRIRRSLVASMLHVGIASLPESLDQRSRPFQIALLHDRLSELRTKSHAKEKPYDFYLDSNIPEIQKAFRVLEALRTRLDLLIQEWPDQMVLRHLQTRCDSIMSLSLTNPVAKILTALEQLLLHTEDWEKYSNRDNSLKAHRQILTELIVDWRRLELACWQDLLRTQALSFSNGAFEWWFHLYEAVVQGVITAAHEEEEASDRSTDYFDKLVPLLDDYVTRSPIGQFEARLQLLSTFEVYIDNIIPTKAIRALKALRRVQCILQSTISYYSQYSGNISTALKVQRDKLEKDMRNDIKLASWKDVNVHALKQSAQRTHRQLYKCIRKFRDVLRQPVSEYMQPASQELGASHSPSVKHGFSTVLQRPSVSIHAFPSASDLPQHLANLDRTFSNFEMLVTGRVNSLIGSYSPIAMDGLATDIITVSKSLAKLSVPANLAPAQREKLSKSFMLRKRKAWSDLLKELKRVGFASNMRPRVLEQQASLRWLREQPQMTSYTHPLSSAEKGEEYLNRLVSTFPVLRMLLSSHHEDVSTRELQRGILLLESGFEFALGSRSCVSNTLHAYKELKNVVSRCHMLLSSKVVSSGSEMMSRITNVKDTTCKLTHALNETLGHLRDYEIHQPGTVIPSVVLQEIEESSNTSRDFSRVLGTIVQHMRLTECPVLLEGERAVLSQAMDHITSTMDMLHRWSECGHPVDYFVVPVVEWLEGCQLLPTPEATQRHTTDSTGSLITTLLVNIQAVLSLPLNTSLEPPSDCREHFIREEHRALIQITRLLGLEDVLEQTTTIFGELLACPPDEQRERISRILPFLDRYVELAEVHLSNHCEWTKALLKLDYVICSVMRTVAKEGFCKPPDTEEAGPGEEGAERAGGTGLGEGTGDENVSKEIAEESQVEGMQGEDGDADKKVERAEEGNAVEMSEDFDGQMEDVPENESDQEQEEQDDEEAPEEQLGSLDATDPSAIDEKLWGDESGPRDAQNRSKADQDHSTRQQSSDVVAKDEQESIKPPAPHSPKTGGEQQMEGTMEETTEEDADQEDNGDNGAPMDDYIQDANTLDLPEDMKLDSAQDVPDADDDDISMDDAVEDAEDTREDLSGGSPEGEDEPIDEAAVQAQVDDSSPPADTREDEETAVAQPDLHTDAGDGSDKGDSHGGARSEGAAQNETCDATNGGASSTETSKGEIGASPYDETIESQHTVEQQTSKGPESNDCPTGVDGNADSAGTRQGLVPSSVSGPHSSSNARRSLGDAMREIIQRFDEIIDAEDSYDQKTDEMDASSAPQLEYLQADDDSRQMQALGPARQEEVAKLSELKFTDASNQTENIVLPPEGELDVPSVHEQQRPHPMPLSDPRPVAGAGDGVESALTRHEILSQLSSEHVGEDKAAVPNLEVSTEHHVPDDTSENVEVRLRAWQAEGQPDSSAQDIWRCYESLTHDLSYALCEQLRLILEPTLATRLKGDYRTGKRLNMKKIIPYIASEFTKDKIWLRRTRPSQREYQVLIALDDSKSMAESHSVHLAYSTLALVSRALGRLEVGDIAIAKFGESVDILHSFEGGPFTDQAGAKIMTAFRFDQKATQVLLLVENSLRLLQDARERRSMMSSSASDLWQLEIIISDGICQDHERLRTVLRRAEEQRVMIVFIILDSLHTKVSSTGQGGSGNSILSMNQVAYKTVNGRMDLHVERYLDTFPFEYYLVLRDVEALPEVLSGTLKQFFERISEE